MSLGVVIAVIFFCVIIGGVVFAIILPKYLEKKRIQKNITAINEENATFKDMMTNAAFNSDKTLHFFNIHFAFDNKNRRLFLKSPESPGGFMLNYKDILNYEIIENGQTLYSGSAGKAVAGAVLFGAVGAIVGSTMHSSTEICSLLQLRLTVNNIMSPSLTITLIAPPGIPRNSYYYIDAVRYIKEIIATLDVIRNQEYQTGQLQPNQV